MATGAKRHTHKYHRIKGVWHCAKHDCTHFMPSNVAVNMPGKASVCWTCGREMLLDDLNLKMERPICVRCNSSELTSIGEFLKSKGL